MDKILENPIHFSIKVRIRHKSSSIKSSTQTCNLRAKYILYKTLEYA